MSDTAEGNAAISWPSMASLVVGGMVGGGIYVALGVVVEAAGEWAWLSFVIAGVIAVSTAYSYAALSNHFDSGGGAFEFLEEIDRTGAAGSLSWVLLASYTLTIALYAFAFGEYVAHSFGVSGAAVKVFSVAIIGILTGLILSGIAKLTLVEVLIVSVNLVVLVFVALAGIWDGDTSNLVLSSGPKDVWAAGIGAAAIFVSYEGFQLLTYEYDHLESPKRTLVPTLVWSSLAVVGIYVLVAIGTTMIIGADAVVEHRTVALSFTAQQAFGSAGLVAMTIAAAFATSAAINSTLFSTARLSRRVADDGELPRLFNHSNSNGIPDRSVVVIATAAAILSVFGSLSALVEAASLGFLAAFGVVNVLAWREGMRYRWVPIVGLAVGGVIGAVLTYRLATTKPISTAIVVAFFAVCFIGRPWLLSLAAKD